MVGVTVAVVSFVFVERDNVGVMHVLGALVLPPSTVARAHEGGEGKRYSYQP